MSQTVIIVGASRGIGASLAREYAARGANLGLLARSTDALEALATELRGGGVRVETAALDVADRDAVAPVLNQLMDRRIIETNLLGAIAVIDAAVARFKAQQHGRVVGISSISAYRGIPGSGAYSASKAALTNYLDALNLELSGKGIGVTVVHPGFVKTDIGPNMEKYPFAAEPGKVAREIANGVARGKKNIIVPGFPWRLVMPALKLLPDSVMKKVF